MENLNKKQREIIKLAFNSKDPALRRRAVETIVTARYRQEFLNVVMKQRFQHPETGNMVTWKSLPSQSQKRIYGEWQQAQKARGEDGGGGGADEGGGGEGGGKGRKEGPARGHKHADRKELRSTRNRKARDSHAGIGADHELRGLAVPEGMSARVKKDSHKSLDDATYETLDNLRKHVGHALENPDGKYMQGLEDVGYERNGLKKLHKAFGNKMVDTKGKKFHKDVLDVANDNDLEEEDADVLRDFREDKPGYGRHHTWPELFQKFLSHRLTTPETKERMKDMNVEDFKKMYLAIMKDEDEDEDFSAIRMASEHEPEERKITIFDPPSIVEKTAKLTSEGRRLVRTAFRTKDSSFREKVLKVARAELDA